MKSLSLLLMVALSSLAATTAFRLPVVISWGQCPTPPTKQDFNIPQYLGVWYEYQRFPAPFEIGGTCGTANYSLITSEKIKVINAGIQRIDLIFYTVDRPVEVVGEAVVVDPNNPAALQVSFGNMPNPGTKANYLVVDTDYDTYALVFSCTEQSFLNLNVQFAWVLTRQRGVAPANLDDLYSTLTTAGVDTAHFITVNQTDCTPP